MRFGLIGSLSLALISGLFFVPACDKPADEVAIGCASGTEEPQALMLSWQRDPTTTMTLDWHLNEGDVPRNSVCYKKAGAAEWLSKAEGVESQFLGTERPVFRLELTGLEPATEYQFQIDGYARVYAFRTMPAALDDRKIVFAAGGDTFTFPQMLEQTNQVAMQHDLDFVMWGGDLAYANGAEDSGGRLRWSMWFEANRNTLITESGRVVPVVVGIGNHEVQKGYYTNHAGFAHDDEARAAIAPNFFRLFAFPGQPGYGVLDFGDYLSLVMLDSGHVNPIEGKQTRWLEDTLTERRGVAHVFPVYHVPAYPSHRSFDTTNSVLVRQHWVPLFEKYGVRLAFENHDHTYKRTHAIRAGAVAPDGIVFLGDGAWGVPTRSGAQKDAWYISKFAAEQHAIIVTLEGKKRSVKAINASGVVLDEYVETR